jgi:hypothetical protein
MSRPAYLWSQTEDELQAAVVQALRLQFPKTVVAAIPNGGSRNVVEAAKMKRTGTLAGVPDVVVALPSGRVCWIECKSATGKLSGAQQTIIERLGALGHPVRVCRDVGDAVAFVRECAA